MLTATLKIFCNHLNITYFQTIQITLP